MCWTIHKNITKCAGGPYIRTSRNVLEEEDFLLGSNKGASDVYGRLLSNNGGLLNSLSQSQKPRDLQQLYRRKSLLRKKDKAESSTSNSISDSISDDIMKILHAQQSCKVIGLSW